MTRKHFAFCAKSYNRLKEILGETYDYLEAENGSQVTQLLGENVGIDRMLLGQ